VATRSHLVLIWYLLSASGLIATMLLVAYMHPDRFKAVILIGFGCLIVTNIVFARFWKSAAAAASADARARQEGRICAACGYSRHGLHASSACPECGSICNQSSVEEGASPRGTAPPQPQSSPSPEPRG
jgi:hypothetical protein